MNFQVFLAMKIIKMEITEIGEIIRKIGFKYEVRCRAAIIVVRNGTGHTGVNLVHCVIAA